MDMIYFQENKDKKDKNSFKRMGSFNFPCYTNINDKTY